MGSNAAGNALACVMGLPPEMSNPKSTLLRELYSLTTSPSGRARPLGEVVKEYSSLKRVDFGFDISGGSPITQANALPAALLPMAP